jgi:hypothetical protein
MSKDLHHAGNEHYNVLLVKMVLPLSEERLEVCYPFLHLNVTFLLNVETSALLLQTVAAAILHYVGVWIHLYFGKQFYFLAKNKLSLFVIQANLLDTFNAGIFVNNLIDYAVAGADNLLNFKAVIEFTISADKLDYFITHFFIIPT